MIHVYDDVFKENFHIYYGKDQNAVLEECHSMDMKEIEPDDFEGIDGHTWAIPNKAIVVWTREEKPSVLAHELLHAVSYHLSNRPIPFNADTEEIYAYMLEMITRKVLK